MSLEQHLPDIAIAAALAWGSGLRAYAVVFIVGLAGASGWIELPGHLELLQHPIVLAASGSMTFVEFFADKLPWLDSAWDAVHSFIRIPAGAALAAAVFGDSGAAVALAAAILGGTLTAGVHATKSAARALINTSPEPLSNWSTSFAEDALVPLGLWLSVVHPLWFFALLLVFLVAAALLARLLWRGLGTLARRMR
jgi:hypothetical protein